MSLFGIVGGLASGYKQREVQNNTKSRQMTQWSRPVPECVSSNIKRETMSEQHTPWTSKPLNKHGDRVINYEIVDSKGDSLSIVTRYEHVNVILQSVNNHRRLIDALDKMLSEFDAEHASQGASELCYEVRQLLTELKS